MGTRLVHTATSTISVEIIGNEPPTISILTPADGSFFSPDDVIEMAATVSDTEDAADQLRVSGTSNVDGDLGLSSLPSSAGDWAANLGELTSGNHLITLTVTDTVGQSGTDSVTVSVNGKPTAPEVAISPNPSPSGERLTAEVIAESVDPEGEPVTYEYQWFRDGAAFAADAVSAVVPASTTKRDEYWEVVVTPRDPHGAGEPATASITIGNSPPQVDSVTINPFSPRTTDVLTAVPSGWFDQDDDSQDYEYVWEINGEVDPDEVGVTYPSDKTARDDNVRVSITPVDEYSAGEPVTSSLFTIENTPPTDGSLIIIPDDPQPNDSLSCQIVESVAPTDDDDDDLLHIFTWYADGVIQPEFTSTTPGLTAVIPWGETENGQTWVCEVYADDGDDEGPAFNTSVYISDGEIPDPPIFGDLNTYRNKDRMDLSGYCEPGCVVDISCSDDTPRTFPLTTSCTSSGTFSVRVEPLVRGYTTMCTATCTDAAGNTSGVSDPPAITTVCDPEDEYENGSYGDSIEDPVDEWASLPDSGSDFIEIAGNMLDDDEEDWYVVTALDDVAEDLDDFLDNFKFEAKLDEGTESFNFVIYRDDGAGGDDDSCMPDTDGYTEYSWFYQTSDDAPDRGLPSGDLRACDDGSSGELNICEDNTADFLIQVKRNPSAIASCDPYRIIVTNGE